MSSGYNGYMGQIKGPFTKDQEIYTLIKQDCLSTIAYISHLGIQTVTGDVVTVNINGETIEIGNTGMYEIRDTEVTSIIFNQDMDENTIIDYVIKTEK